MGDKFEGSQINILPADFVLGQNEREYFVFCPTFSAPVIELEMDTEIEVRISNDLSSFAAEINISNLNLSGSARLIINLSD